MLLDHTHNIMKPCVYLFPFYLTGHLPSMVEVAKRLLNHCDGSLPSINILLYQPNDPRMVSPMCSSYLQSVRAENLPIHFHTLPSVELPTHYDDTFDFLAILVRLYLPHIKAALMASPYPVSSLIIDLLTTDVIDVAKELNIPTYIYMPSTATSLLLLFHLSSTQHKNDQVDHLEVEEEICVPGLTPIPSLSMPDPLLDKKSTSYRFMMYHARRCMEAKGIIVNSNFHIEKKAVEALANGVATDQLTPGWTLPEIYPIGPVISLGRDSVEVHKCVEWLDKQPVKSVVYLCFGSGGAFEAAQVRQIAIGLEQSGHQFLWVLRMPTGNDLLSLPADANLEEILPEGFLERTKGRGMVWHSWAPQIEILSHHAIGGFVTHCGWNSTLESLWFGVPVIPWPLYSEQHLNAFQLVREIRTAVPLEFDRKNNGFVAAVELKRAIKQLMDASSEEGRRARDRAADMMSACRNVVQREGVSYIHLQKLTTELMGRLEK